MKKALLTALLLAGALALATMSVADPERITASKHDLSTTGLIQDRAVSETQVCVFCHTPHGASPAVPLWNHTLSQSTFQVYEGLDLEVTPDQPTSADHFASAACLSCHDGTVAVNSLVNNPVGGTPAMGSGHELTADFKLASTSSAYVGTDLRNDHPIAFNYDTSAANDAEIDTRANAVSHGVNFFGANSDQMECASCHDVHKPGQESDGDAPFLVRSNDGSGLCLSCHIK
jgi:predicted CXXCH cytochrome family protein